MAGSPSLLTVQFLAWVASRPRTWRETREAWHSTCPLNCAWEDAVTDDLVRIEAGAVLLTPLGRAVLERETGSAILDQAAE